MAVDSIKCKNGNEIHSILRTYYKTGSSIYPIKSIWSKNGQDPVLIWPKEYDSVLTVVPNRDINNYVGAAGGEVGLTWYLTVYYPNTLDKVPGFEGTNPIPSSQIITNDDWVIYYNGYLGQSFADFSQSNKSKLILPNRGKNGLPSITGDDQPNPYINPNQHPYWTDGSWSYNVRASVNFIINNRTYTAYTNNYLSDGVEVCRQEANDLLNWDGTIPSTLGDAYSNWKSVEIGGGSWWTYWTSTSTYQQVTNDNPAPYTAGTLDPSITAYKHEQWKFTSGSIYNTYRYFTDWNNSTYSLPGPFTFSITNKSVRGDWINVNDRGYVTLTENTSTTSRNARVYLSRPSGLSSSFWTNRYVTVYQAGKPSS